MKEPIRILHVVTRMDAAGLETLIMNFYRNIDRNKVQFDFLTHRSDKGFYDDEILSLGGKIYNVPSINPFHHHTYIKALDNFFDNHNEYRIIHSHINTFSMYPLRSAMKHKIPVRISHSHIANAKKSLFKIPFVLYTKSHLKEYATNFFACSDMAGKWMFGDSITTNSKYVVLKNAIDTKKYLPQSEIRVKLRKALQCDDKFVLLHVGRFTEQKNQQFIVKIAKRLSNSYKNILFLLVGEGPLKIKIEQSVKKEGLDNYIKFLGVRKDINQLMMAADCFLFPSKYEGLGIVAIESQTANLPTLVSNALPEEANISPLYYALPLELDIWCDMILQSINGFSNKIRERRNYGLQGGYDIGTVAGWLQNFYLENWK